MILIGFWLRVVVEQAHYDFSCFLWLANCDLLAAEFPVAGISDQALPRLQPSEYFDLRFRRLPQRDISQARNFVRIDDVDPLQLTPLDHCCAWDQQGRTLAASKLGASKEARPERRVGGQFDFHEEASARRVCRRNNLHHLSFEPAITECIDGKRHLLSLVHIAKVCFIHRGFEAIVTKVFDGKDWHAGTGERSDIGSFFRYEAIEWSHDMCVTNGSAGLLQRSFRLRLPGTRHLAACLSALIARLDLVEFLRAHRLLFKKGLVAFKGRIGEREIRFGRGDLLLGRRIRRRSVVESGARLRVVNDSKNLPALDAIPFVHRYFEDVAHHLSRQLAGLCRAEGSHRLDYIGNARCFRGDHRNVAYRLWDRNGSLTFP